MKYLEVLKSIVLKLIIILNIFKNYTTNFTMRLTEIISN